MLRAESINHTSILVNDLDRAREFYVEMLGMKEIPSPSRTGGEGPRLCRLDCGGGEVTLFKSPKPFDQNFVQGNGFHHHSFRMNWEELSRLARDIDGMRGAGYTLCEDPGFSTRIGDDNVQVRMLDPDGNRLELAGRAPGALWTTPGTNGDPAISG